jgi:histidyl-tRNA synthetase
LILEHEIPHGSRLYFGKSAKLKRDIEAKASSIFIDYGFEEIVTPNFSYDQYQSIDNKKDLISINDIDNNSLTLRADSTLDVVRLITKRLGRSVNHKKWFYIQPVFTYPANEHYQIGAEIIDEKICTNLLNKLVKIVTSFEIQPVLLVSNIKIPQIISREFNIPIESFKNFNTSDLLTSKYSWLRDLVAVSTIDDINEQLLQNVPSSIKNELLILKNNVKNIEYENIVIAPLYYSNMKYYDSLYFRMFSQNRVIAKGGTYQDDGLTSSGFAIYTDNLIEEIMK